MADEKKEQKSAPARKKAQPHPGDLTPGMYAEQEVGLYEGELGTPEALAHGEKFQAAKRKQRFGY